MTRRAPNAQTAAARESRFVPLIIGAALFLQTLDGHSIATVLPAAAASFGVTPLSLNLALTVYFAGAAAFLPISGWCADRFGARRVFQAAIVGFLAGSIVCAISRTPTELLIGRAVQGMSGAGLLPVGRLVLIRTSEKSELIRRLTYLTIPPLLGPLFGPLIGGAAATYGSWRWIFLLNVAIGLIGIALVSRHVPHLKETHPPPLDKLGAILSAACLISVVLLLERAGRSHLFGASEWALFATTVATAALYLRHYRRASRPILDLSLFRLPTFHAGTVGGLFFRLSVGAEPFLYAMLFQIGLGLSPMISGALTLVTSVGMIAMRSTSVRFIQSFGFRRLLIVNALFCAVTLAVPAFFTRDTPLALLLGALLVRGFFRSLQLNALNAITYAEPPPGRMSGASSLAATIQQMAQGLSMAAAAAIIALAQTYLVDTSRDAIGVAFLLLAALSLVSLPFFVPLSDDAGSDLSGRKAPKGELSE